MELPVMLKEYEVAALLRLFRSFEEWGFRLPFPDLVRTEGQKNNLFVLMSRLEIGPTIVVGATATLTKDAMIVPTSHGIKILEDTGAIGGKSEILLYEEPGKATYTLVATIGKKASPDIASLCDAININRVVVTRRYRIEERDAKALFVAAASWANKLIAAKEKYTR